MKNKKLEVNALIKLILILALIAAAWVGKITIEWAAGTIIFLMILF